MHMTEVADLLKAWMEEAKKQEERRQEERKRYEEEQRKAEERRVEERKHSSRTKDEKPTKGTPRNYEGEMKRGGVERRRDRLKEREEDRKRYEDLIKGKWLNRTRAEANANANSNMNSTIERKVTIFIDIIGSL